MLFIYGKPCVPPELLSATCGGHANGEPHDLPSVNVECLKNTDRMKQTILAVLLYDVQSVCPIRHTAYCRRSSSITTLL